MVGEVVASCAFDVYVYIYQVPGRYQGKFLPQTQCSSGLLKKATTEKKQYILGKRQPGVSMSGIWARPRVSEG